MLKNDWTLTHFLFYITWFGILSSILVVLTTLFIYYQSAENALLIFPHIDPLVEIQNLEIEDDELLSNNGDYLMPLRIYSNVGIASFGDDFSGYNLPLLALRLAKFGCLLLLFLYFSRILKSVIDKNPFNPRNHVRLYLMGIFLIGFSVFDSVLGISISSSLNNIGFQSEIMFKPVFNVDQFVYLGLILVVLGFVFKEATLIHEEQKLTV